MLLSFWFMFRRSSWCYLFAGIASMVRYEGTALIAAAFVLDMIYLQEWRLRLRALGWAVLASMPFVLWMLGTYLSWDPGRGHYLKLITQDNAQDIKGFKAIIPQLNLFWHVTFEPLLRVIPGAGDGWKLTVGILSKIVAAVAFLIGMCYGLYKRHWNILALLIFLFPYFLVHVSFPFLMKRFHSSIHWIVLLIGLFGLQSLWVGINRLVRIPRGVCITAHLLLGGGAIVWLFYLLPSLPRLAEMSFDSRSIPWVTLALLLVLLVGGVVVYRTRKLSLRMAVTAILFLMIVSNQFTLANVIRNGKNDYECKLLADWCLANVEPDEKVLTIMTSVLNILLPEHRSMFLHTTHIEGDDSASFVRQCYEKSITYVAWDSRKGLYPKDPYYQDYRLHRIAALIQQRDVGPFEYITTVGNPRSGRFINIFRLRPRSD